MSYRLTSCVSGAARQAGTGWRHYVASLQSSVAVLQRHTTDSQILLCGCMAGCCQLAWLRLTGRILGAAPQAGTGWRSITAPGGREGSVQFVAVAGVPEGAGGSDRSRQNIDLSARAPPRSLREVVLGSEDDTRRSSLVHLVRALVALQSGPEDTEGSGCRSSRPGLAVCVIKRLSKTATTQPMGGVLGSEEDTRRSSLVYPVSFSHTTAVRMQDCGFGGRHSPVFPGISCVCACCYTIWSDNAGLFCVCARVCVCRGGRGGGGRGGGGRDGVYVCVCACVCMHCALVNVHHAWNTVISCILEIRNETISEFRPS